MYAKLYYYHNPYALNPVLDVMIALVAAGGLSTITFIIIVHSKKPWMPIFFASMDFVGGLLFYGKDLMAYYAQGAFIEIGSALFIPFFKASAIYFVGEIFLEEVNGQQESELSQTEAQLTSVQADAEKQKETIAQLRQELQKTQTELGQLKKESKEWRRKSYKYDINNVKRSLNSTQDEAKIRQKQAELERLEKLLAQAPLNGHEKPLAV
ncbi:MAG: hypothetical protein HC913_12805 [Microscillaceae bacterium]|nr:hypothetical protein [Microscillaceae bacterium]